MIALDSQQRVPMIDLDSQQAQPMTALDLQQREPLTALDSQQREPFTDLQRENKALISASVLTSPRQSDDTLIKYQPSDMRRLFRMTIRDR